MAIITHLKNDWIPLGLLKPFLNASKAEAKTLWDGGRFISQKVTSSPAGISGPSNIEKERLGDLREPYARFLVTWTTATLL